MPRLLANAMRAAEREIRADIRAGAVWADAHLTRTSQAQHRADVLVDSSLGFDESRHPTRGRSPLPPTTIVIIATAVKRVA
jgi:hypothetical protein